MIGKTILHYKILEKLGEGGMGIVYKALDTKLNREVAIKFLPHHITPGEEERKRFKVEAQAAAALNHPNIATIHAVEEVDSETFIVMEYIKGRELKDIIQANLPQVLNLREVLEYAIQIAEGLQAAHEEGVIHRDIKSANIMITEKGQVKIMDFGLAKLIGGAELTKKHSTLGTAAYMSPEQARGEDINLRTDIWSFGVVLYELLTGQMPFKGEYDSAVLYSILNEEPESIINLRKGVPTRLEQIVQKCLEKEKGERYEKAEQLLNDLNEFKNRDLNKPAKIPKGKEKQKGLSRFVILLTLIAVVAVLTIITTNVFKKKLLEPKITHVRALTKTANAFETIPVISPDGSRVVYSSDESGNRDIWVHQIATGKKINLTEDYKGIDSWPSWSPDGKWIAFMSSRDGGGIYIVSESGGIPRQVTPYNYSLIQGINWFPDSEKLLFLANYRLYSVIASGGEPDSIPLPYERFINIGQSWSSDGQRIIYATWEWDQEWENGKSQIWSAKLDGSDLIKVFETTGQLQYPIWTRDDTYIFFKLTPHPESMRQLLWMPVDKKGRPTGPPRKLGVGVNYYDLSISYDGRKMAYLGGVGAKKNMLYIPLNVDRILNMNDVVKIPIEKQNIWNWTMSPDHEWIAFCSDRSGQPDIWLTRIDGKELRQLTSDSLFEGALDWSPDGNRIVFEYHYGGKDDIHILTLEGGSVKPIVTTPSRDRFPAWSPDGEEIVFNSERNRNSEVCVVSVNNGKVRQLTDNEDYEGMACWSPDGKTIAFISISSQKDFAAEIYVIPAKGGKAKQLTNFKAYGIMCPIWSPDGKMIYTIYKPFNDRQAKKIVAVNVQDGTYRNIFNFDVPCKLDFALATDNKNLYFMASLFEGEDEIWLADLVYE